MPTVCLKTITRCKICAYYIYKGAFIERKKRDRPTDRQTDRQRQTDRRTNISIQNSLPMAYCQ